MNDKTSLIQLSKERFSEVERLFENNYPNRAYVEALLEGRMSGVIWADNADYPQCCLVMLDSGYRLIGGRPSDNQLRNFLLLSKPSSQKLSQLIYFNAPIEHQKIIQADHWSQQNRFFYDPLDFKLIDNAPQNSNPEFEVFRLDRMFVEQCQDVEWLIDLYGSLDKFLKHGFGFCVIEKQTGKLVAEALGCGSSTKIEFGIATHRDYQRKGLACQVAYRLAQHCKAHNIQFIWSTKQSNIASQKTAERLGFCNPKLYCFWEKEST